MVGHDLHQYARLGDGKGIQDAVNGGMSLDELDEGGATPLCRAIAEKQEPAALMLLELGAAVEIRDSDGSTALHWAVEHRLPGVLKAMLEVRPAAIQIADKHGNQPLWTAAFNARGDYTMVKMLLQAGADPYHRNRVGLTPVDIPKRMNDPELLRLLESGTMKAE